MRAITLDDIQSARERTFPYAVPTPTTRDEALGQQLGAEIWFKWENRQTTGSFKLRGALNKLLSLSPERATDGACPGPFALRPWAEGPRVPGPKPWVLEPQDQGDQGQSRRVIAASSGNHGLGVAYAARMCGVRAVVYVPDDASRKKLQGMAQLGAEVVTVPGGYGAAEDAALVAVRDSEAVWVSAYNDAEIVAGQGTLALEWLEQVPALDLLLVPVGGGGLISGVGLAAKALKSDLRIVGVQAAASAALYADFYGRDMDAVRHRPTLAHGLAGPVEAGSITVPLVKQVVDEMLLVSEAEIGRAVAYVYRVHGEVIEGAGAVGLAVLLAGKVAYPGRVVGVLVSGGNVDPDRHAAILARQATGK